MAGPAARRPAHRQAHPGAGARRPRGRARRAGGGPGPGRHVVRLAVRRRQRAERLLLPLPRRLRPGRPALPALRDADPPRGVHEPVELQLPDAASPGPRARRHVSDRVRVVALVPATCRASASAGSSARRRAAAGLTGSAENLPDGRVEAVLEGPADDVRARARRARTVRGAGSGRAGRDPGRAGAGEHGFTAVTTL